MSSQNKITAKVILARKPDSETMEKIEAFVRKRGCANAVYEIDSGIIGGIIVYIGDIVYDGSVKSRLEKIRSGIAD